VSLLKRREETKARLPLTMLTMISDVALVLLRPAPNEVLVFALSDPDWTIANNSIGGTGRRFCTSNNSEVSL
jgi:hypothetical protein